MECQNNASPQEENVLVDEELSEEERVGEAHSLSSTDPIAQEDDISIDTQDIMSVLCYHI